MIIKQRNVPLALELSSSDSVWLLKSSILLSVVLSGVGLVLNSPSCGGAKSSRPGFAS